MKFKNRHVIVQMSYDLVKAVADRQNCSMEEAENRIIYSQLSNFDAQWLAPDGWFVSDEYVDHAVSNSEEGLDAEDLGFINLDRKKHYVGTYIPKKPKRKKKSKS